MSGLNIPLLNLTANFSLYIKKHMNLLAHLYLSKGINDIMIGNFIGDFVKGNQYLNYSEQIQKGILLHREIDSFTDNHESHKLTRDRFRKEYGLHSGVVVDIIYDHFLANNWTNYHNDALEVFAQEAYTNIQQNFEILPEKMKAVVPFIINNNWIILYRSVTGIERVLYGMSKKTSLPNKVPFALEILNEFHQEINAEFTQIITDLHKMVEKSLYLTKFAT